MQPLLLYHNFIFSLPSTQIQNRPPEMHPVYCWWKRLPRPKIFYMLCVLHNLSFSLNWMTNSGEYYFQHCFSWRDREECGGIPAHKMSPGGGLIDRVIIGSVPMAGTTGPRGPSRAAGGPWPHTSRAGRFPHGRHEPPPAAAGDRARRGVEAKCGILVRIFPLFRKIISQSAVVRPRAASLFSPIALGLDPPRRGGAVKFHRLSNRLDISDVDY